MDAFKCDRCGNLTEGKANQRREIGITEADKPARPQFDGFKVVILMFGRYRNRHEDDPDGNPELCGLCFTTLANVAAGRDFESK
jgi:hypothetical protein